MIEFQDRIQTVKTRILRACECCGRDPGSVELLPVSKRHPAASIREMAALGFRTFGENYVQEGVAKAEALPDLGFVLIGPLQRNKAKPALLHFQDLMTVDRPSLAVRLKQLAAELSVVRRLWIQVDLWDESSKMGGCPAAGIPEILECLGDDPHVSVQGFLAIPPPELPQAFEAMAQLRGEWQQRLGRKLRLSMGMSDDLEAAIHAGSDQVRIGTALFGERA